MEPIPPPSHEAKPVARWRWWIHLILITAYMFALTAVGLVRSESHQPALSHSASGLVYVCVLELLLFGFVFGMACLASRASRDDLLLRWRTNVLPVLLGAAYSVGLRIVVGIATALVAVVLLVTQKVQTLDSLQDFFMKHRPVIESAVDVSSLRDNPGYFWLTLTIVSFVVAGLREELWRSSFLAGVRALWPRRFGSTFGQICAVFIAAIIFGLAHLSMGFLAALLAGVLGLSLGLIMVLHRSIWPAVFAHGFFDATSMALIPWAMELMQHLPKH
ncbi:MAG TPA: CPBP family intramembrane glutamic endopeptidase [Verrucomicrobiae bacterium]|jgi:membrane protease YdiL (CAAX protease family)|nr:CPBP family intramembrane glutamic endopeptidase [Verrucomicrobiae bacterium]